MTEPPDPFEAELASFRPPPPSPELRRRIGERLAAEPAPRPRRSWRLIAVAVGAAVAAALAAVLLGHGLGWWGGPGREMVQPPPAPAPAAPENRAHTLWTYHRALAESPEAATALLDREAVSFAAPPRPVCVFSLSDPETLSWLGDL